MGGFQQTAQFVGRHKCHVLVAAPLDDGDFAVARDLVEQGSQVFAGVTVCRADHRFNRKEWMGRVTCTTLLYIVLAIAATELTALR